MFVVLTSTIYLISCNKAKKENLSSNEPISYKDSPQVFNVLQKNVKTLSYESYIVSDICNNSSFFNAVYIDMKDSALFSVHDLLLSNFSGDLTYVSDYPLAIIIYHGDYNKKIEKSKTMGLSYFTQSNDSISHRFFKIIDNSATEDYNLYCMMSSFNTEDFDVLLNFSLTNNTNNSAYMFFNNHDLNLSDYCVDDEKSFSYYCFSKTKKIPSRAPNGCHRCNGSDGKCVSTASGGNICDDCAKKGLKDFANSNDIIINLDSILPYQLAYDFRDNFLKNYEIGKKYIKYYYQISYFIGTEIPINLDNFFDHLAVAEELYNVAYILLYGNDRDIVINSEFRDDSLDLINYYLSISNSVELNELLIDIKNDLDYFVGKSKSEVIQLID